MVILGKTGDMVDIASIANGDLEDGLLLGSLWFATVI